VGQNNIWLPFKALVTNALQPAQIGKQSELWTSARHGKYYAPAYAGASYFIGNTAGVTLVAAAATTYTGLAIQNPAGSGVNVVIQKFYGVGTVISAAMQTVAIAQGHTTFTPSDSITPLSAVLGASAAAAKAVVSASATLDSSYAVKFALGATQIAAGSYAIREDFDGGLIIPPGQYIAVVDAVGTPTASSFMGAFFWEEVAQ
jgi:hypothetical protein